MHSVEWTSQYFTKSDCLWAGANICLPIDLSQTERWGSGLDVLETCLHRSRVFLTSHANFIIWFHFYAPPNGDPTCPINSGIRIEKRKCWSYYNILDRPFTHRLNIDFRHLTRISFFFFFLSSLNDNNAIHLRKLEWDASRASLFTNKLKICIRSPSPSASHQSVETLETWMWCHRFVSRCSQLIDRPLMPLGDSLSSINTRDNEVILGSQSRHTQKHVLSTHIGRCKLNANAISDTPWSHRFFEYWPLTGLQFELNFNQNKEYLNSDIYIHEDRTFRRSNSNDGDLSLTLDMDISNVNSVIKAVAQWNWIPQFRTAQLQ